MGARGLEHIVVDGVVEPSGELDGFPVEHDAGVGQQCDRSEHLVQVSERVLPAMRLRPARQQVLSQFPGQVRGQISVLHRLDLNRC